MVIMFFDPNKEYHMPGFFGPIPRKVTGRKYNDVTTITVSYLTDRDQLAKYLPPSFEVGELPIITVSYACNKGVEWLAGRSYNLIGVSASVKFKGKEDQLEGALTLAMWENLTDPILTGREIKVITKIYADIPDHQISNGQWRVNASHYGNQILKISADNLTRLSEQEMTEAKKAMQGKDNWMGYKYIPNPNGVGPALSYPTLFPAESVATEVWLGQGEIQWEHLTWEQNPTQFHIINALADLPNEGVVYTAVTKGTTELEPEGKQVRALK
jgi:acetoacetate decarboxylase